MNKKYVSPMFGTITLGADPEIFLTTKDGKPHGARDCSVGTKEKPEPLVCGALQVDGMALEYNIDPAATLEEWLHNHNKVLDQLEWRAEAENLAITDASFLDFNQYIKEANATEEELEFGCDPDFNAGTGVENEMPDNSKGNITYRTTGGHVHVGFENWLGGKDEAHETARSLVKVLDATLGLWSVFTDEGYDRKVLYGKAGAFRVKPYGFEYRTLSNFWVFDKEYLEHVFTTVMNIMSMDFEKLNALVQYVEKSYSNIQYLIDANSKDEAKKCYDTIMKEFVNA